MAKTKTSTTVKDRYNRKAYDDLRVRLPKGQKDAVQQAASEAHESINEYANKALLQRMGLTDWPSADALDDTEGQVQASE